MNQDWKKLPPCLLEQRKTNQAQDHNAKVLDSEPPKGVLEMLVPHEATSSFCPKDSMLYIPVDNVERSPTQFLSPQDDHSLVREASVTEVPVSSALPSPAQETSTSAAQPGETASTPSVPHPLDTQPKPKDTPSTPSASQPLDSQPTPKDTPSTPSVPQQVDTPSKSVETASTPSAPQPVDTQPPPLASQPVETPSKLLDTQPKPLDTPSTPPASQPLDTQPKSLDTQPKSLDTQPKPSISQSLDTPPTPTAPKPVDTPSKPVDTQPKLSDTPPTPPASNEPGSQMELGRFATSSSFPGTSIQVSQQQQLLRASNFESPKSSPISSTRSSSSSSSSSPSSSSSSSSSSDSPSSLISVNSESSRSSTDLSPGSPSKTKNVGGGGKKNRCKSKSQEKSNVKREKSTKTIAVKKENNKTRGGGGADGKRGSTGDGKSSRNISSRRKVGYKKNYRYLTNLAILVKSQFRLHMKSETNSTEPYHWFNEDDADDPEPPRGTQSLDNNILLAKSILFEQHSDDSLGQGRSSSSSSSSLVEQTEQEQEAEQEWPLAPLLEYLDEMNYGSNVFIGDGEAEMRGPCTAMATLPDELKAVKRKDEPAD